MSPHPDRFVRPLVAGMTVLIALAACHARQVESAAPLPAPMIEDDVALLASDSLEGRGTGTAGNDAAARYLAERYRGLGLVPPFPAADSACRGQPATGACAPGYLQPFVARPAMPGGAVTLPTANVAALVPGTDPALRGQVVVLGAHFDHLGRSPRGALDPAAGDAIRNGADDNASGTAAVLELARRFRIQPARRTVLVANFSAEELGLLGSQWMVEHSPVPLDSVQAMVNFDMVGRLRDERLVVYGTSTARELPALLDSANGTGLVLAQVGDGFGPSDHSSFFAQGIPVLHLFTDLHGDYHRATDDADRIDYAGLRRVVDYAEAVARRLADHPRRLTVVRDSVRPTAAASARSGRSRVYLGSIPDMAAPEGVKGLRLTGITPGSPADKAGLQAGDVVVEFGGTPVTDLYTYTDALRSHEPGETVTVVAMRGGERKEFTVTLGTRER